MRVRLTYLPKVVEKPVLAEIILKTGVAINILKAEVNTQKGELILSIPAKGNELEGILNLFRDAEVKVQKFTEALQIDYDRCTACGACISPCPTRALRFGPKYVLEYVEEKCVACGTCITACPVKAITLP